MYQTINPECPALNQSHLMGEAATYPISRRASPPEALRLLANDNPMRHRALSISFGALCRRT
ncbi:protein of unknown function [Methylocaldum szegediense]|uniref:Uncharacterized protein n=1 Tax=Methylocaldum szegediense TaxID=73780 RepID=A0ABN8X2P7_9GAMM|nr:protein of unknown function [Methylocaldum szegediense]